MMKVRVLDLQMNEMGGVRKSLPKSLLKIKKTKCRLGCVRGFYYNFHE